ncbi:hypothetical protein T03_8684 [Trichinella britovi]|uniref:Uncharacterized protein n=1 Tax=Trichinella britovi TaxID=45882 RepID=A0A0V1D3M7_TRIBR|nr:hypothetical protein T03_8684 [Trichinella britovi]
MLGNEKCHRQLIWTILLKGNGSTSGRLTRRRQMVDKANDQCGYTLVWSTDGHEMVRNGTHVPVTQPSSLCEASSSGNENICTYRR